MTPYVGQLLLVPYTFAPEGWLFCDGSLQQISNYEVLYALIGTTFGGDGVNTFGLPDLRGRTPIGMGNATTGTNYVIGQMLGVETVTLTSNQMPAHNHVAGVSAGTGNTANPSGGLLANGQTVYHAPGSAAPLNGASINALGGSQPHDNLQPYLTLNWVIAWSGVYPSQN